MRTKQEKRLSQENLGKMTEEARRKLIENKRMIKNYSELEFEKAEIIDIRPNSRGYQVTVSPVPKGEYPDYTFYKNFTQNLELID